ncbi:MAG: DUF1707 SHOCT-like domain-containing protein [Spirochaetota bacterium]
MSDSSNESLERLREHVIEQLSTGYSRDFLSEHEFEQRLETATAASDHSELRSLLVDLPLAGAPNPPAVSGSESPAWRTSETFPINTGEVSDESTVIAIFSGSDRKGLWYPPKTLNVVALFGGSDIDLREAVFPPGGLKITAVAMFGGVDIIVPEGINVEVSGAGIFGAFEGKARKEPPIPGAPTVRVDGIAFFGGVDIKYKRRK